MHIKRFQFLGYLQIFIGMGALSGGLPMLLSPDGSNSGLNIEHLQNTPFENYLIPGILLVLIIGAGNLVGSYFSLKFKNLAGHAGIVLGFALMIWIATQMLLLGNVSWLQPIFLLLGITELVLGISVFKKSIQ